MKVNEQRDLTENEKLHRLLSEYPQLKRQQEAREILRDELEARENYRDKLQFLADTWSILAGVSTDVTGYDHDDLLHKMAVRLKRETFDTIRAEAKTKETPRERADYLEREHMELDLLDDFVPPGTYGGVVWNVKDKVQKLLTYWRGQQEETADEPTQDAERRAAEIGRALSQHRNEHGALPDTDSNGRPFHGSLTEFYKWGGDVFHKGPSSARRALEETRLLAFDGEPTADLETTIERTIEHAKHFQHFPENG